MILKSNFRKLEKYSHGGGGGVEVTRLMKNSVKVLFFGFSNLLRHDKFTLNINLAPSIFILDKKIIILIIFLTESSISNFNK